MYASTFPSATAICGQCLPRHHQQGMKTKVSGNAASRINGGQWFHVKQSGNSLGCFLFS
jgi:hypothetical protein